MAIKNLLRKQANSAARENTRAQMRLFARTLHALLRQHGPFGLPMDCVEKRQFRGNLTLRRLTSLWQIQAPHP